MSRCERAFYVVLRGYATSWMTWVVVALVLAAHLLIVCNQTIHWNAVAPFEISGGRWKWNNLPHDRGRVDRLTLNVGEIIQATNGGSSRLQDLGSLPNLKHLVIEGTLTEPQLIEVSKHLKLESLSIRHLEAMEDAGWTALEHQPLKRLQIHSLDTPDWTVVRLPKTIESLDVSFSSIVMDRDATRSHLEILPGLPNLMTTTLQLFMSPASGLRNIDREILQSIPSLKRVYVDPQYAELIQRELPRIAVRPTRYQSNRVTKATGLVLVGMIPLFLILHFLSLQFAATSSVLMPRFHAYHFGVAFLMLTLLMFAQFLAFLNSGFQAWAAVAMAGAVLIPAYTFTVMSARTIRFAGFINVPSMIAAIAFSDMIAFLTIVSDRAEADWMFQGQRPDLIAALIALEAISVVGFYRFFARLVRNLSEKAPGSVPYEVWNVVAWQRWIASGQSSGPDSWFARLFSVGPESRLQAALRCPRESQRYHSRLWRAGTPTSAFGFACSATLVMLLIGYFMSRFPKEFFNGTVAYTVFQQALFMTVMGPWMILWQWRPHLSRHLLMSLGRREWVQLVFLETAYDFLPTICLGGTGLIAYAYQAPSHWWPAWHVALLGLAMLGLVYAALLTIITTVNIKLSGTVFFALILAFIAFVATFVGGIYIYISVFGESALEAWMNCPPVWWVPLCIVAIAAIRIAYRRWMIWELAAVGH